MPDLFTDGIRSIAVANGVVRLELVQHRRTGSPTDQLTPEPVGTLLMPAASLKDFTQRLVEAVERIAKAASKKN